VLRIKKTGTWLWLAEESARPAWLGFQETIFLSPNACANPEKDTGFSAADASSICGVWGASNFKPYIHKSLAEQKVTFAGAAAMALIGLMMLWFSTKRGLAAIDLQEKIAKHEPS